MNYFIYKLFTSFIYLFGYSFTPSQEYLTYAYFLYIYINEM